MCTLDGNIQSEIVFEPLELEPYEIENLFGDIISKKILGILVGSFSEFTSFTGKLFVSDSGVVALSFYKDVRNRRMVVFIKIIDRITVAYEVNPDARFKVFFFNGEKISRHEFKLNSLVYGCMNNRHCGGVCWAVPVYIILPKLYPEVCENVWCGTITTI